MASLNGDGSASPPKWAIANGLFVGPVPPELARLSFWESQMLALSSLSGVFEITNKMQYNKLKSHLSLLTTHLSPPAASLPRSADSACSVFAKFVGYSTRAELVAARRKYQVNVQHLRDALTWLREFNRLYSNVSVNAEVLTDLDRQVEELGVALSNLVLFEDEHEPEQDSAEPAANGAGVADDAAIADALNQCRVPH